jgi:hypothetical protein
MRKTASYKDDFEDWGPAVAFERVVPRARRLQAITVSWRGEVHCFEPTARLMFGKRTLVVSPVTLWPPTTDPEHPFPREGWAADIHIRNVGFIQGNGASPQAALDALDAELPTAPLVRGGSC